MIESKFEYEDQTQPLNDRSEKVKLYAIARKNGYRGSFQCWMVEHIKQLNEPPPKIVRSPSLHIIREPPPPRVVKHSRIERIRNELGLNNVKTWDIQNKTAENLTAEEQLVKYTYCKELRVLPYAKQQQILQTKIDNGTFPLPKHPCKYCLCGLERTMSQLVKDTIECASTPIVKVKEFLQFRYQAIIKNKDTYNVIEMNDLSIQPILKYGKLADGFHASEDELD